MNKAPKGWKGGSGFITADMIKCAVLAWPCRARPPHPSNTCVPVDHAQGAPAAPGAWRAGAALRAGSNEQGDGGALGRAGLREGHALSVLRGPACLHRTSFLHSAAKHCSRAAATCVMKRVSMHVHTAARAPPPTTGAPRTLGTESVYTQRLALVRVRAVALGDDVLEGAAAGDHGQHVLDVRHHHVQQVGPRGVQHLPHSGAQL